MVIKRSEKKKKYEKKNSGKRARIICQEEQNEFIKSIKKINVTQANDSNDFFGPIT